MITMLSLEKRNFALRARCILWNLIDVVVNDPVFSFSFFIKIIRSSFVFFSNFLRKKIVFPIETVAFRIRYTNLDAPVRLKNSISYGFAKAKLSIPFKRSALTSSTAGVPAEDRVEYFMLRFKGSLPRN